MTLILSMSLCACDDGCSTQLEGHIIPPESPIPLSPFEQETEYELNADDLFKCM